MRLTWLAWPTLRGGIGIHAAERTCWRIAGNWAFRAKRFLRCSCASVSRELIDLLRHPDLWLRWNEFLEYAVNRDRRSWLRGTSPLVAVCAQWCARNRFGYRPGKGEPLQ